MPANRNPQNDKWPLLLQVGPFGGIDPTTESYYVSQTNFVDMVNLIPNVGYGGYVVTPGRVVYDQIPLLPHHIIHIAEFSTTTSDGFIVITDNAGIANFYYCVNGVATPITVPSPIVFTSRTTISSATYGKWIFITNGVDKPVQIDTSLNLLYWGITAPTTAPTAIAGAAGNLTGTFIYTVTFANADEESGQAFNPTTQLLEDSTPITVTAQSINLLAVPVSSEPGVTKRNIYRQGGGNGTWNYVGTINDNTTTTYTDNLAVGDEGQVLVVHRDPALPFKVIVEHNNAIFGFNPPGQPALVYYSNFNEPWAFSVSYQVLPVGDNSLTDAAIGMAESGGVLGLVKDSTLYGLFGSNSTNYDVQHIADIGGVNQLAVISAYGSLWYVSRQGVYQWSGSSGPVNISDGGFQKSNIKKILDNMADSDLSQAVMWAFDQMIGVSFPSLNISYIWDTRSQAWYPIGWATDHACFNPNMSWKLIGQNLEAPGEVDRWFAAGGDFGQPILASLTSGVTMSQGAQYTKKYRYLIVEVQPQNAQLGMEVIVNTGLQEIPYTVKVNASDNGPVIQYSLPEAKLVGKSVQLKMSIKTNQVIHLQKVSIFGEVNRAFIEGDAKP